MSRNLNPSDAVRDRIVAEHRARLAKLRTNKVVPEGMEPQSRGDAVKATEAMTPKQRQALLEQHGPEGVFNLLGRQPGSGV